MHSNVGFCVDNNYLVSTDFKNLNSQINFNDLYNGSVIEFYTELKPVNITAINKTFIPNFVDDYFYIVLNESDKNINIKWEKK